VVRVQPGLAVRARPEGLAPSFRAFASTNPVPVVPQPTPKPATAASSVRLARVLDGASLRAGLRDDHGTACQGRADRIPHKKLLGIAVHVPRGRALRLRARADTARRDRDDPSRDGNTAGQGMRLHAEPVNGLPVGRSIDVPMEALCLQCPGAIPANACCHGITALLMPSFGAKP
jgi:hypothetical protein